MMSFFCFLISLKITMVVFYFFQLLCKFLKHCLKNFNFQSKNWQYYQIFNVHWISKIVTKKMTLAFWAVEHFLVIFHQICIKYTKSIWFSALKWGTVHFCTYLEIKDTGKNVKKCFFQFHHFCKKKFVKIMHHTLHHFCMNFLAKACLFLQKFKTYLKVTFQGLLRRYTTLF